MKKIFSGFFIAVTALLLTGCGDADDTPPVTVTPITQAEIDPFHFDLVAQKEFDPWVENLKETFGDPILIGDHTFEYHKIESAEQSTEKIKEIVASKEEGKINIVLWLLSPHDFEGTSQETAESNLEKNKALVEEILTLTLENDYLLLAGSGIPRPPETTDEFLILNHNEYLDFLIEKSKSNENKMFPFSFMMIFVDDNGLLIEEYRHEDVNVLFNEEGIDDLRGFLLDYITNLSTKLSRS